MSEALILTVLALGLACLLIKAYDYISMVSGLKGVPSTFVLMSPGSLLGNIFDLNIPFVLRGSNNSFGRKWQDYESIGWNLMSFVSPFPHNDATIYTSDKNVIKDITSQRAKFPKPIENYFILNLYGDNVLITEGAEWKRHRKISQPAFSEQNNRLVHAAVGNIMTELLEDVWELQDEVVVENSLELGLRLALIVLGVAAFGKEMHWKTNSVIPAGHEMDFAQALYLVCSNTIPIYAMPRWAMGISEKFKKIRTAAKELDIYTSEIIEEKLKNFGEEKMSDSAGKSDLLTSLVAASEEEANEAGGVRLSKSELKGNIFIFLLAGHETTAHTLTYCLALLALCPNEQEKLLEHIQSIIGEGPPKYEDFPQLTRVHAAINETLRMFPPVYTIPKKTSEDSVFTVSAADPKSDATQQMVIPAGRLVMLHTPGLHYNPRYWEDPYSFKPDRFLGDWDRDAFIPFSAGSRACAGKKFAEVELTAVLSYLIPRYSIHLTKEAELEQARKSMKEKVETFLKTEQKITLTPPEDLKLVFKKRKSYT